MLNIKMKGKKKEEILKKVYSVSDFMWSDDQAVTFLTLTHKSNMDAKFPSHFPHGFPLFEV